MKRLPLAIILIASMFAVSYFAGGYIGTSVQCANNQCAAMAGSSPISIMLGIAFFAALLLIPRHAAIPTDKRVGFLRMVAALFLDMMLVITGLGAILALPMLAAESTYTGSFEWAFERPFVRPTDWILSLGGVLVAIATIVYLRFRAVKSGAAAPGQYLMGYSVRSELPVTFRSWLRRTAWAMAYLAVWPLYLIYKAVKKPERDLWDQRCGTSATRLEYS